MTINYINAGLACANIAQDSSRARERAITVIGQRAIVA
jgi:hypothetical protein